MRPPTSASAGLISGSHALLTLHARGGSGRRSAATASPVMLAAAALREARGAGIDDLAHRRRPVDLDRHVLSSGVRQLGSISTCAMPWSHPPARLHRSATSRARGVVPFDALPDGCVDIKARDRARGLSWTSREGASGSLQSQQISTGTALPSHLFFSPSTAASMRTLRRQRRQSSSEEVRVSTEDRAWSGHGLKDAGHRGAAPDGVRRVSRPASGTTVLRSSITVTTDGDRTWTSVVVHRRAQPRPPWLINSTKVRRSPPRRSRRSSLPDPNVERSRRISGADTSAAFCTVSSTQTFTRAAR
jgi:hypothetical protein